MLVLIFCWPMVFLGLANIKSVQLGGLFPGYPLEVPLRLMLISLCYSVKAPLNLKIKNTFLSEWHAFMAFNNAPVVKMMIWHYLSVTSYHFVVSKWCKKGSFKGENGWNDYKMMKKLRMTMTDFIIFSLNNDVISS